MAKRTTASNETAANIGYEAQLWQMIDMISNTRVGNAASCAKDVLDRSYEYFLLKFASAGGKKGSAFYAPRPVVRFVIEMLEVYRR